MPAFLLIETSTQVCSVAFTSEEQVIYSAVCHEGPSHAVLLGQYVKAALQKAKNQGIEPDAVAVSSGPGSYTGLRIGVSMAKGVCWAKDIPLIAVETLPLMTSLAIELYPHQDMLFCPMVDARRMEVYAAIYNRHLEEIRRVAADIVDDLIYAPYLASSQVCFFGNGASKCKEILTHPHSLFPEDIHPLACAMRPFAEKAFAEKSFQDRAYFEPFYLKEFIATIPKKKF